MSLRCVATAAHRTRTRFHRARRWTVARRAAVALGAGSLLFGLVPATSAVAATSSYGGHPSSRAEATPGSQANAPTSPDGQAHVVSSTTVRLITGDLVRLMTWSDGRTTTSLLPGSPSLGKPTQAIGTPTDSYVIPDLPVTLRDRLDVSLFDITRLAGLSRQHERLPLLVTFAAGAKSHALPGLQLDLQSARRDSSGGTTVAGSYSTRAGSVGIAEASGWAGVTRVALPDHKAAPAGGYQMHTLTVDVTTKNGDPVPYAEVVVQNVDDAALMTVPLTVVKGTAKVSVPDGHYAVIADDFNWLVTNPDFTVDADTTVTLNKAAATIRPEVSVGSEVSIDVTETVERTSERRGSLTMGFENVGPGARFYTKLQPVPAKLPHGSWNTLLADSLIPSSADCAGGGCPARTYSSMTFTKDMRHGVPADLSFSHRLSQFASVREDFYSNGPAGRFYTFVYGFLAVESFAFINGWPAAKPGSRTVRLQASPRLHWMQEVDDYQMARGRYLNAIQSLTRTYPDSGQMRPVEFLRGPDGPGQERGIDGDRTGRYCLLCRDGSKLRGLLPLFSAAGTGLFGLLANRSMGSWRLSHGRKALAKGYYDIAPRNVRLPASRQTYTLTASSHPGMENWQLSTRVTDQWQFSSAAGTAVVPLLMPRYVPPTDLAGVMPAGKVAFRLDVPTLGPTETKITSASVLFSTNHGRAWHKATLTRLDANSFRVSYRNPTATGDPSTVALMVSAEGANGGAVTERALNAYTLGASSPVLPRTGVGPSAGPNGTVRACPREGERVYTCFALVAASGRHALTAAGEPAGWGATDLRSAYALPHTTSTQTVAVVVAGDYPTAETDLAKYRRQFALPPCTSASGCFTKINQDGDEGNYPRRDPGWALEAALDLQMISTACPTCHIVLAEANRPTTHSLDKTVDAAAAAGAVVTNHSYGIQEYTGIRHSNEHYNANGVTAVAATGDYGFQPPTFPASSPDVVAVGGTALRRSRDARGWREHAWRFGGSGCSAYFSKPGFQDDRTCHMRTDADLAAVAADVAVYDSFGLGRRHGWFVVDGTSASSPLVAGMIGAAGAGGLKPGALYANPGRFHDITAGANGFCHHNYICTAKQGYDGPTGLGTPRGLAPFRTS